MRTGIPAPMVSLVRRNGVRRSGTLVSIRYLPDDNEYRYTIVIAKRQGGAVERNRVRRSIRGIMQEKMKDYPRGWYLIYYNASCAGYARSAVEEELDTIAGEFAGAPNRLDRTANHGAQTAVKS